MEKKDIVSIAEGLRLIEMGVEKIQGVMREIDIDHPFRSCIYSCLIPSRQQTVHR
jgi:hypothetical protein